MPAESETWSIVFIRDRDRQRERRRKGKKRRERAGRGVFAGLRGGKGRRISEAGGREGAEKGATTSRPEEEYGFLSLERKRGRKEKKKKGKEERR